MNGQGSTQRRTKEFRDIRRGIGSLINMLVSHHIARVSCPKITNRNGGQRIVFVSFVLFFFSLKLFWSGPPREGQTNIFRHAIQQAQQQPWPGGRPSHNSKEKQQPLALSLLTDIYIRALICLNLRCVEGHHKSRCVLLRLTAVCSDSLVDEYSNQEIEIDSSIKTRLIGC